MVSVIVISISNFSSVRKNLSREDYLNRSGRYTQNADEDRTRRKANGSVLTNGATSWFAKGSKSILSMQM